MRVALDTGVLIASVKRREEKFHDASLALLSKLSRTKHEVLISVLVLEELRGALASSTLMPAEKIFEVEASLFKVLNPLVLPFDDYVEKTRKLLLQFREVKRRRRIPSADFHHLATALQEKSDLFVTIDERHILNGPMKEQLSILLKVVDPVQALDMV
ncbi:MAG: type II toxin-antitoxin system VapC family toxin [Thermoproteota archaeon]